MSLTPEARLDALEESVNVMVSQLSGKTGRDEASDQILDLETQVGGLRTRMDQMRDQVIAISTRLRQVTSRLAL